MLFASLCLQASLLVHPVYLEPEKPELRSLQHILLLHDEMEGLPFEQGRGREEALELMRGMRERAENGADFGELAKEHSNARTSESFGSLGCFPPRMLQEPFNSFLFDAELGEMSDVLDLPNGIHLLKRVETHAGILQIQIDGVGEEQRDLANRLLQELREGADFGELAKEHSTDRPSAERGGAYRVFERGSSDTLLKLAAFRAPLGGLAGPIETPLGLHIIRRVDPATLPKNLWEDNYMRVRAILVAHLSAMAVDPNLNRTQTEAKEQAEEVIRRVRGGESFAEIAARFNDDPGGKERAGDLGWIHRQNPDLPHFFSALFVSKPGTLTEPFLTPFGVVVLIREQ